MAYGLSVMTEHPRSTDPAETPRTATGSGLPAGFDSTPSVEPAGISDAMSTSAIWRRVLDGSDPSLARLRRMWSRIPSSPRCKLCAAPFHGPGRLLTRVLMHGASSANPLLCNVCFGQIRNAPGGAEIGISVLFADIRGSTGIAERTTAAEFRRLVQGFYRRAARAIDDNGGIIDKFLGDGIMILFIPVISGNMHARRAIEAGEALLQAVADPDLVSGGVRVGAGVHTGDAFVGAVGSDDRLDFTALGDTVNVAARLGSEAGGGELLVSDSAWRAAGRIDARDRRELIVKGRQEPLGVVVLGGKAPVAVA
jgi:adenylate cyclase